MTEEEYQDVMQIGITDEMKGIKMTDEKQWIETDKLIHDSGYLKGWNEAIEAAAKISLEVQTTGIAEAIRKLKK